VADKPSFAPDLSTQQKRELAARVQEYFRKERDEEIGEMAAGFLLDFVAELIGPYYYNEALKDAQKQSREWFDHLEADLMAMERPVVEGEGRSWEEGGADGE
jgi:uncharacterized protein (DUF2164 family)